MAVEAAEGVLHECRASPLLTERAATERSTVQHDKQQCRSPSGRSHCITEECGHRKNHPTPRAPPREDMVWCTHLYKQHTRARETHTQLYKRNRTAGHAPGWRQVIERSHHHSIPSTYTAGTRGKQSKHSGLQHIHCDPGTPSSRAGARAIGNSFPIISTGNSWGK